MESSSKKGDDMRYQGPPGLIVDLYEDTPGGTELQYNIPGDGIAGPGDTYMTPQGPVRGESVAARRMANLYQYAGNRPTVMIDPSGEDFIAVADRKLDNLPPRTGYHYSVEYWITPCTYDMNKLPRNGYSLNTLQNSGGTKNGAVELLADSSGWRAKLFTQARARRPREVEVWVSVIKYSDRAEAVLPIFQSDPTTVARMWDVVLTNASTYPFAEQQAIPPFRNWPNSNYATWGTNSNSFVRWVVQQSGMTMVEIPRGAHPGDMPPRRNRGGGIWDFRTSSPPRLP